MRNPFSSLAPKISNGIQIIIKALKSFSQLFAYKLNEEKEMEIGFPTDVKHLTHIGWDGSSTTTNPVKGWENLRGPPELVASPSISLKQFELAMAAQAADQQLIHQIPVAQYGSKLQMKPACLVYVLRFLHVFFAVDEGLVG